ncbi:hypothetical protein [Kineococcus terrestris]|uniref:hypothetical protein n=1 Tax=Kineococcus terrestris TaxID=2044856 RepID=UPI0034DAE79A
MSRKVLGLDRLVAVLLGLVLVAAGAAAVAWYAGWLAQLLPGTPERLSTGPVADAVAAGWFAGACAAAAVVLALLALWWLIAHVPRRGAPAVSLPGSRDGDRLVLEADAPADAAAEALAAAPGVRSASGRTVVDRGRLVVELRAVVEPSADLEEVGRAADEVSRQLRTVVGRGDVAGRVRLSVARGDRTARVR